MAGPIPNFTPGYNSWMASAKRCAELCQKACLPSGSSHLNNLISASVSMGRVRSHSCSFTDAANTSCARRVLIERAISNGVTPCSYCLTLLSGKVILIIANYCLSTNCHIQHGNQTKSAAKIQNFKAKSKRFYAGIHSILQKKPNPGCLDPSPA